VSLLYEQATRREETTAARCHSSTFFAASEDDGFARFAPCNPGGGVRVGTRPFFRSVPRRWRGGRRAVEPRRTRVPDRASPLPDATIE
jgi:hypothetical protein